MNKFEKTPKYIALYLDSELKKNSKRLSSDEMENKIEKVMKIFCFISGRDEFLKVYCKLFAKRLLDK